MSNAVVDIVTEKKRDISVSNENERDPSGNLVYWIFGILLLGYYLINIEKIYTIWELGDEAGYIFNASLFAGYDWKEVFSNYTAYYGFGYSLLLIPVFLFCDPGISFIWGIVAINVLCVVALYIVQIYVMSKLLPDCKKWLLGLGSMVVCLYPYLVGSSMKTICEVFLTLQLWLIGLLIYMALETQRRIYHILLVIVSVFVFFVHTRSIAVLGAAGITWLFALEKRKEKKWRRVILVLIAGGVFLVTFILLYQVKKDILGILGTGSLIRETESIDNIISGSYLIDRIQWLFSKENMILYPLCIFGKFFYLICSSAGTCIFGLWVTFRNIIKSFKPSCYRISSCTYVSLYFCLSFCFMLILCTIGGTGSTYAYNIYGRYYEYTIGFFIFMGLYVLTTGKFRFRNLLAVVGVTVLLGIFTACLSTFSAVETVGIDTNRLAGFSYAISKNKTWAGMIYYSAMIGIAFICAYFVLQKTNIKKILVPLLVLIWMIKVDSVVVSTISDINQANKSDIEMAEYIVDNFGDESVYFVYEDYTYEPFYSRMQVFLKDKSMHVIYPEEYDAINDSAVIITYRESVFSKELKRTARLEHISESNNYELFYKKE